MEWCLDSDSHCQVDCSIQNQAFFQSLVDLGMGRHEPGRIVLTAEGLYQEPIPTWPQTIHDKILRDCGTPFNEYSSHFMRGYFEGDWRALLDGAHLSGYWTREMYEKQGDLIITMHAHTKDTIEFLQRMIMENIVDIPKKEEGCFITVDYWGAFANTLREVQILTVKGNEYPLSILDWIYEGSTEDIRVESYYLLYLYAKEISSLEPSKRFEALKIFTESNQSYKRATSCTCDSDGCAKLCGHTGRDIHDGRGTYFNY